MNVRSDAIYASEFWCESFEGEGPGAFHEILWTRTLVNNFPKAIIYPSQS